MRDKIIFGGVAVGVSLVFFVLLSWLKARGLDLSPNEVGFLVPVLAVMIAARGVEWRRKLVFVGITLAGSLAIEGLAAATGVTQYDSSPHALTVTTAIFVALALAYALVQVAYPIGALVLFVGRRPSVLWEADKPTSAGPRRRTKEHR